MHFHRSLKLIEILKAVVTPLRCSWSDESALMQAQGNS